MENVMTRIPLHPLLFAMLPVLTMFAVKPGEAHTTQLVDSARVAVAVSGLLLLVTAGVYRDVRKAALLVSTLLLLIVGFDSIFAALESISVAGWTPGRRRYVLPLTYAALGAWSVWLYRRQTRIDWLTGLANVLALGMVLPPAVVLGMARTADVRAGDAENPIVAGAVAATPDIYYLVFDRYGDEHTARAAGIDNDIDEYLTGKGFYVAPASRSNYIKTALSLASSLNADYLDQVARGRESSQSWQPVYGLLERHRVGAFLRSQGYTYTHLGPSYYPTRHNPMATRNINYYTLVPAHVTQLLETVALEPVHRLLRTPWLDVRMQKWISVRRQVDDVVALAPERGPKFVLLHVLVPHPPYVFAADGSYLALDLERRRTYATNYRNDVLAANAMIRRLVDGILARSSSPPVIIVQGDEGPYPPGTERYTFDWRTAGIAALRQRSGILNAYFLPGGDRRVLYPTISPANSFRIVFNTYFGTRLPLLPDRTFRHVSDLHPFPLDDITDLVTPSTYATDASRP
jgi:hypothetical protein